MPKCGLTKTNPSYSGVYKVQSGVHRVSDSTCASEPVGYFLPHTVKTANLENLAQMMVHKIEENGDVTFFCISENEFEHRYNVECIVSPLMPLHHLWKPPPAAKRASRRIPTN